MNGFLCIKYIFCYLEYAPSYLTILSACAHQTKFDEKMAGEVIYVFLWKCAQKASLACVTTGRKEGQIDSRAGSAGSRSPEATGMLCASPCHKRVERSSPNESHSNEHCKIFTISDHDTLTLKSQLAITMVKYM